METKRTARSRFYYRSQATFGDVSKTLRSPEGKAKIDKVHKLTQISDSLGCSVAVLSLAWAAKNGNVTTVILGASKKEQLLENLKALDVIDRLTPQMMERIDEQLGNKPEPLPAYGRD